MNKELSKKDLAFILEEAKKLEKEYGENALEMCQDVLFELTDMDPVSLPFYNEQKKAS